jgi:16S rRNA (cytosine1402-N4)-methyltransferase
VKNFYHLPVLVQEMLDGLCPKENGRYADGTIGGGGHAELILKAGAGSWLGGSDWDGAAVEAALSRLAPFGDRVEVRRGAFETLADWIKPGTLDGVLLDLGVSSPQLDEAGRGFSLQKEGPLDMRMDDRQNEIAADWVNTRSAEDLANIFWELGGERHSRRIAGAIIRQRELAPLKTTIELADVVEKACPRRGRKTHPATRAFQALRMAVNNEAGELKKGLPRVVSLLKPGGRLAIITFHSGEDRTVKQFGREETRDYDVQGEEDVPDLRVQRQPRMRWVNRKAIRATEEEESKNPRARSAQLRVLEKLGETKGEQ